MPYRQYGQRKDPVRPNPFALMIAAALPVSQKNNSELSQNYFLAAVDGLGVFMMLPAV